MIWTEWSFNLPPGEEVWMDGGRKLVSKLVTKNTDSQLRLPPIFFHHGVAGGSEHVPIRIEGRKNRLVFVALGDSYCHMLDEMAIRICQLIGNHYKTTINATKQSGRISAKPSGVLREYFVNSLVFVVKQKRFKHIREAFYKKSVDDAKIHDLVKCRIEQSLCNQVAFFDQDPEDVIVGDISIGGLMPIKIKHLWVSVAKDVRFRCNLNMTKTPYHVGHFKNYGFGRVRSDKAFHKEVLVCDPLK